MATKQLDFPFKVKAVNDDGVFSGYGSVFNVLDAYNEVVVPGAFTDSLKTRQPALLWQHRSGEPIGVYTDVKEDCTSRASWRSRPPAVPRPTSC